METTIVNIKSGASYDQYIGRVGRGQDGYFGNPFHLGPGEKRGATIERYKLYFHSRLDADPQFKQRVLDLKGKTLGCFCKPHACHGDIIAEYLNNQ